MNEKLSDKRGAVDHIVALTEAALSAIPTGGGIVASLMQSYIPSTLEQRKSVLLNQLADDLQRLQIKVQDAKVRSESFHVTLIKAMRHALIEKHVAKLNAFRAIILNEAVSEVENPEAEFFIKITENLTGDHIRLLLVLADPEGASRQNAILAKSIAEAGFSSSFTAFLEPALPGIPGDHIPVLIDQLHNLGLISVERQALSVTMTSGGVLQRRTTSLSDRYLRFITLPPEINNSSRT